MGTVEVELDEELLALIDGQAAASGRPRAEVIADALRRQLRSGRLHAILTAARERSDLTDDQAMKVAVAELDAYRSERTAGTA